LSLTLRHLRFRQLTCDRSGRDVDPTRSTVAIWHARQEMALVCPIFSDMTKRPARRAYHGIGDQRIGDEHVARVAVGSMTAALLAPAKVMGRLVSGNPDDAGFIRAGAAFWAKARHPLGHRQQRADSPRVEEYRNRVMGALCASPRRQGRG
jgi:hypothetical protein